MDPLFKALCPLPAAPVRREPSHRSEMVSQLLFGETFGVYEVQGHWLRIYTDLDHYHGWIDRLQCHPMSNEFRNHLDGMSYRVVAEPYAMLTGNDYPNPVYLPCGSIIHGQGGYEPAWFPGNTVKGFAIGSFSPLPLNSVCQRANNFLGAPYLWGGKTFYGFDCSGFVQIMMRLAGILLPRDAHQQAIVGEEIGFAEYAQSGDVAFFDNEDGHIVHAGLILSPGQIIHASGRVRIDRLDHHGIYNYDLRRYSHRLRIIRRYKPGVDYLKSKPAQSGEPKQ
jgi:gamma-D-glutamyl-L-lysine dipeptidyl-peptidase